MLLILGIFMLILVYFAEMWPAYSKIHLGEDVDEVDYSSAWGI